MVVMSKYAPASLQWRHSYGRLGHLAVCFRNSLASTFTTLPQKSSHLLGQGTKVKSQPVRCASSDRSSPIHLQPSSLFSQYTISDLTSRSPTKYIITQAVLANSMLIVNTCTPGFLFMRWKKILILPKTSMGTST